MPAFAGHTTGREPLDSSGSYRPNRRPREPMGEQVWLTGFNSTQPAPRSLCVPSESFVFPLRPSLDERVYRAQCTAKRGTMKPPVIVDPANKDRPSPLDDIPQGEIVAMMQLPATHDFAHCLGSFVADRRRETDKQ